jgi:Protein of unknown function (DUF3122)
MFTNSLSKLFFSLTLSIGLLFGGAQPSIAAVTQLEESLILTKFSGRSLTAQDVSSEIPQDSPTLTNVAEYDIKSVLPQLKPEMSLQLTLPVIAGEAIELKIPPVAIEEWQVISNHHE